MPRNSGILNDGLKKAARNSKERERKDKMGIAFAILDETLSDLLRRYGRQRKWRRKRPTQLELLREAIEALRFLKEELTQLEGIRISTTNRTEATSAVPDREAPAGYHESSPTGHSSEVIPVLSNHLEQNVTKPCSHDSGRSNDTELQEAQHTQMSTTEGRGSQPFIQHCQFQCNHSQQLSDAGNLLEPLEDYSLDCPLRERPGFIQVLQSPGYVNPIPDPSSCLTPLLTPPISNHPNHTVIHPLPPPLSHHTESLSTHTPSLWQPTLPFWDQGYSPPLSPPRGVLADLLMGHISSPPHETLYHSVFNGCIR